MRTIPSGLSLPLAKVCSQAWSALILLEGGFAAICPSDMVGVERAENNTSLIKRQKRPGRNQGATTIKKESQGPLGL